jgi:hypothetical protein
LIVAHDRPQPPRHTQRRLNCETQAPVRVPGHLHPEVAARVMREPRIGWNGRAGRTRSCRVLAKSANGLLRTPDVPGLGLRRSLRTWPISGAPMQTLTATRQHRHRRNKDRAGRNTLQSSVSSTPSGAALDLTVPWQASLRTVIDRDQSEDSTRRAHWSASIVW